MNEIKSNELGRTTDQPSTPPQLPATESGNLWTRVEAIFSQASEIDHPEQRARYLEEQCQNAPEVLREVQELLRYDDTHSVLDDWALKVETPIGGHCHADPNPLRPGTWLGRYELIELLGEGGMGAVWLARQLDPVKRQVAIKVIKCGFDSRRVLARFAAERQALALMDHEGIAKILDAGTDEQGRPYFAMELVKGEPLMDYCSNHRLTITDRLRLFLAICDAVQHAHQKGILHRDLKPSNILISLSSGSAQPKIIDFGLAKALDTMTRLTDHSLQTEAGLAIGTLQYMSPEQALLSGEHIDTRSDIYGLGVILFELLTNTTPIDRATYERISLPHFLQLIREQESPRPSQRLRQLNTEASNLAISERQTTFVKLVQILSEDLDWITWKCLEKQPNRRYPTVASLADDIARCLRHEPVTAQPPTRRYYIKKFIKRHQRLVTVAFIMGLVTIAGILGISWALYRAIAAEKLAEIRLNDLQIVAKAEREASERARVNGQRVQRSSELISGIFQDLDIQEVRSSGEPLEAILANRLEEAASWLAQDSNSEPLETARMHMRLAVSLSNLGYSQRALPLMQTAYQARLAETGPTDLDTVNFQLNLSAVLYRVGENNEALKLCESFFNLPTDFLKAHPDERLRAINLKGSILTALDDEDQAISVLESSFEQHREHYGAAHRETLTSMMNLAAIYQSVGRLDQALNMFESLVPMSESVLGREHPETLMAKFHLASAYSQANRLTEAAPLCEQVLSLRLKILGRDHPDTWMSQSNLATLYWKQERFSESIPIFEQLLVDRAARFGRSHPESQLVVANLGINYRDAGRSPEAIELLEEAWSYRGQHPKLRWVGEELLTAYRQQPPSLLQIETLVDELYHGAHQDFEDDPEEWGRQLMLLGESALDLGAHRIAIRCFETCLQLRRATAPGEWTEYNTQSLLGSAQMRSGGGTLALTHLKQGYLGLQKCALKIPESVRQERIRQAAWRILEWEIIHGNWVDQLRWANEVAK